MRRALTLLAVAAAVTIPAAPATASCTEDPCALECARYVLSHLDPRDPSLICPH